MRRRHSDDIESLTESKNIEEHRPEEIVDVEYPEKSVVVDTLGEGISAPKAAAEAVSAADAELKNVDPGLAGWIDLVGVSDVVVARKRDLSLILVAYRLFSSIQYAVRIAVIDRSVC